MILAIFWGKVFAFSHQPGAAFGSRRCPKLPVLWRIYASAMLRCVPQACVSFQSLHMKLLCAYWKVCFWSICYYPIELANGFKPGNRWLEGGIPSTRGSQFVTPICWVWGRSAQWCAQAQYSHLDVPHSRWNEDLWVVQSRVCFMHLSRVNIQLHYTITDIEEIGYI